jgi:CRP-like cAMP-binding protein
VTFLLDALDPHGNGHTSGHTSGHTNGHASGEAPIARSIARLGDSQWGESRLIPQPHPVEATARRPHQSDTIPSDIVPSDIVPSNSAAPNDTAATGDLPTLFANLPRGSAEFLCQPAHAPHGGGAVLATIGESCDKLWFVEEGLLDVQGPPTGPIMAGAAGPILRRGDFYGSHAIDPTATHTVTLTTLCDATIIELPGDALRTACARFAAARRWIEAVMATRPLTNVLRRLAESMPGEEEHLLTLAEQFTAASIPAGQCVQEAGTKIRRAAAGP